MPSIIKTGPKLPSFQKLKKRKRTHEEVPEAPASKKSFRGNSAQSNGLNTTPGDKEDKQRTTKEKKVFGWKKKMADEKEARLKKQSSAPSNTAPKSQTGIVPGQNWQKLKVCYTYRAFEGTT